MDYLAPEYWNKMPDGEIIAHVGPLIRLQVDELVDGGVVTFVPRVNGVAITPEPTIHAACRVAWVHAAELLRRSVAAQAQLHRFITNPEPRSVA